MMKPLKHRIDCVYYDGRYKECSLTGATSCPDKCIYFNDGIIKRKEKPMGKKYIIELEEKTSENAKGDKLYFVKGFNNLSLDEGAIKKLTPYEETKEHKITAGDIYRSHDFIDEYIIVTNTDGANGASVDYMDTEGCVDCLLSYNFKKRYIWTGRNIKNKLTTLLKEIHD